MNNSVHHIYFESKYSATVLPEGVNHGKQQRYYDLIIKSHKRTRQAVPAYTVQVASATVNAMRTYFTTTHVTTASGRKLKIVSDGRGGNGFTHARQVVGIKGMDLWLDGDNDFVTLSDNRKMPGTLTFPTMRDALNYLINRF